MESLILTKEYQEIKGDLFNLRKIYFINTNDLANSMVLKLSYGKDNSIERTYYFAQFSTSADINPNVIEMDYTFFAEKIEVKTNAEFSDKIRIFYNKA